MPTISSSASSLSVTRPESPIPPSSRNPAGPWWPITVSLVFNVLGVSGFEGFRIPESLPDDSPQPLSDLPLDCPQPYRAELSGGLPRCGSTPGGRPQPLQPGIPQPGAAQYQRESLLVHLPNPAGDRPRSGPRPRGIQQPGSPHLRHLFLQLFHLPVDAGQLGHWPSLPHHTRSPP